MPMLSKRLSGLSPQENDKVLADIWQGFAGSEAHQLLTAAINEILAEAKSLLLEPATEPYTRAHAAGQCLALERLLATIRAGASFDPSLAEYDIPVAEDDYVPDDQQRI